MRTVCRFATGEAVNDTCCKTTGSVRPHGDAGAKGNMIAARRSASRRFSWGSIRRHSIVELVVTAQMLLLGCIVEAALRIVPVPRLIRWVRGVAASPVGLVLPLVRRRLGQDQLLRIAAAAARILRGPDGCLPRSFLTLWLVTCPGSRAELVLGVRRDANAPIAAHAWIEADDRAVAETATGLSACAVIGRY